MLFNSDTEKYILDIVDSELQYGMKEKVIQVQKGG